MPSTISNTPLTLENVPPRAQSPITPTHRILTRPADSSSNSSMLSTRATALEVCQYVYGDMPISVDDADRFYEANATSSYENPVITATSRSIISDIHKLSRQLSSLDVPRPLAMICTLLRLDLPTRGFLRADSTDPLFKLLSVWNEVGDICESESFDGHKKTIVEHSLNILILPDIHYDNHTRAARSTDSVVSTNSPTFSTFPHGLGPSLKIPGTSISVPSPLHLRLHVITRLSFNEQGWITHHRDFWDVKDVLGLLPGVSLAQWITSRLAAMSLAYVSRAWNRKKPPGEDGEHCDLRSYPDLETGTSPITMYPPMPKNALGLEGL